MSELHESVSRQHKPSAKARPKVQASQLDYALHTLGWASFQDLCVSVFEVVFNRPVVSHSKTHDGGRDGAFFGSITEPIGRGETRQSTLQTKHFSREGTCLSLTDLAEERKKIRNLVREGQAHCYVLMTNATVTATEAARIEDALRHDGVVLPAVLGRDWITRKIHESPKIRATVPRLYGLGDLSWIVDERAVAQATEVLSSLGNDMVCYVRTKAHLKAVDALLKYGFVLLIGEPAAGKSTIAANLAVAAIDIDECDVVRVTGPQDVVSHWNPREKNRFFWVDDAFGTTQYRRDTAELWNKVLPTMSAAIKCGNRFVLTSRDYIWRQAQSDIKTSSFKPLLEGRVVIYAEDLTVAERERILYNHIKFGDQPLSMRRWMKPHLQDVAASRNFKPEIARRLGSTFFTKDLVQTPEGLLKFVDAPKRFLSDVLEQLEPAAQGAVALIFLNGGRIASPITQDESVAVVEATLGVACPSIRAAMEHLNNTLFLHISEAGQTYWTFKHPTIADAYASLIASRPELIEIYLRGAKSSSLVYEVVCGVKTVRGAPVRVPRKLFNLLSSRLLELRASSVRIFLSTRADSDFRKLHVSRDTRLISADLTISNPLVDDPEMSFYLMLDRDGMLDAEGRTYLMTRLEHEIVHYGDVTFLLDDNFKNLLGPENYQSLLKTARSKLIPNLESIVASHAADCDADDPEGYFEKSSQALEALEALFPKDNEVRLQVEVAGELIAETISQVSADSKGSTHEDWRTFDKDTYAGSRYESVAQSSSSLLVAPASVFDDLDQ